MLARYTVLRRYASLSRRSIRARAHRRLTAIVFNPAQQAAPGSKGAARIADSSSCAATDVIAFRSSSRVSCLFRHSRAVQLKYSLRGNAANRSEDKEAELHSKLLFYLFHVLIMLTSYRCTAHIEIS